jgi:hypothetical protein
VRCDGSVDVAVVVAERERQDEARLEGRALAHPAVSESLRQSDRINSKLGSCVHLRENFCHAAEQAGPSRT